MSNAFSFKSNTSGVLETMKIVVPKAYVGEEKEKLEKFLKEPLKLMSFAKKIEEYQVPENLFDLSYDTSGDLPVAIITWSEAGWDRMSYNFLKALGHQVKTNPKSVPRSIRMFGGLMDRLTDAPIGKEAVDKPRKIVIDRAIEQFGPTVRQIIEDRLKDYRA